ncbi:hypothetical protein [Streptomyces sp. NPDC057702]|uniref:hypothetical protein n=1 Tax=unclassified Streptomyces TaxID=2593676 RepID=UPI00369062B6
MARRSPTGEPRRTAGRVLRRRAPALLTALLVLSIVSLQAGCDSSSDSAPSDRANHGPERQTRHTEFRVPESVLLLTCSTATGISLTALSVRDGSVVSSASGDMPADQNPSGSYACHDGYGTYPASSALRQMFNEDYTLMAGRVTGPGGAGHRAVAFETRTGLPVGPEAGRGSRAGAPEDSFPVFHEGDLWYVDRQGRLRSRPPANAPDTARDRGEAVDADGEPMNEVSFGGGVAWYARDAGLSTSAIHPTGGYIAEHNSVWNQLQLRRRDAAREAGIPLGKSTDYGEQGPRIPRGSVEVPDCSPEFWLDSRDLICSHAGDSHTQILRVGFTADLQIVRDVERLLPGTGLPSYGAVPSPDKRQIAFLAKRGDKVEIYRQSLRAGARPVRIAEAPDAGDTYLLGWN